MTPAGQDHTTVQSQRRYRHDQIGALPLVALFFTVVGGLYFAPRTTAGLLAVGLLVLAILCVRQLRHFKHVASGKVVDFRVDEGCYYPIVEFTDTAGAERREPTLTGTGVKSPPTGSRVDIVYAATGQPGCEIDKAWRRYSLAAILVVLAAVFALGAILGR